MQGICWLAVELLAPLEGLRSVELVAVAVSLLGADRPKNCSALPGCYWCDCSNAVIEALNIWGTRWQRTLQTAELETSKYTDMTALLWSLKWSGMELSIDPHGDDISGYTVLSVTDMDCVPRPPVSFETFIVQGCSE